MTSFKRPERGKDYRILAVKYTEQTRLVGRVITVQNVLDMEADGVWVVHGKIHGVPGGIDVTAALSRETGQCMCAAYEFPHSKTKVCK